MQLQNSNQLKPNSLKPRSIKQKSWEKKLNRYCCRQDFFIEHTFYRTQAGINGKPLTYLTHEGRTTVRPSGLGNSVQCGSQGVIWVRSWNTYAVISVGGS